MLGYRLPGYRGARRVLVLGALAGAAAAGVAAPAQASAWTKSPGEVFVLSRIDYFKSPLLNGGQLERIEAHAYGEFGVAPMVTLGAKVIYGSSWTRDPDGDASGSGISVLEGFVQRQVRSGANDALSVRLAGAAPSRLAAGARPDFASDGAEAEIRLLYGRRISVAGQTLTAEIETAYRKRFAGDADQLRMDTLLGWRAGRRLQVFIEGFSITSIGNNAPDGADFDLYKIQPSLVVQLNRTLSIQAGINHEFAGRGIARGDTAFIGLWAAF